MAEENGVTLANQRWKQSDITTLRTHLSAGDTLIDVSRILERSPESVMMMISRLRLPLRSGAPD
ncbi:hypothetical protein ASE95_16525 [Sphingomonas sp. Leaf231]|uniref:hypothetical protein n=1 Tax=Sphingomonas sp. Leaf231 TaxID=1736301 RepID=UPI0006F64C8E|nr:hypothetical protein [Sphingomonas sp. Leaf231]KQN89787.1 hypothetical protein ASE95_16525 [Sphingomonas sp. Leaf231]